MGPFLAFWPLLASFAAVPTSNSPTPNLVEVNRIFAELSATTGFRIRHPVKFEVLSRQQVNRFLEERIREAVRPAELRAEELTLKKLGFVPADFDLKKTTIALLTEQTAAFYDYHRKQLFLTDWASASLRDAATVHEMAHALADQNFSLERFAKKAQNDTEKAAARQAVVEGQASWLMRELAKRSTIRNEAEPEQAPFPEFDRAPRYLRETLTFPYNYGTEFQQAVYARFGKESFRRVFLEPPISTQQILHPEMYFAGTLPAPVSLPAIHGMKMIVDGSLGELEHSILLRQWTTSEEAGEASPHWRGGRFQLWENRKSGRISLVYGSVWDSESSAANFFSLYRRVLQQKLRKVAVSEQTETLYAGTAEDGYFDLQREGTAITAREGLALLPRRRALQGIID